MNEPPADFHQRDVSDAKAIARHFVRRFRESGELISIDGQNHLKDEAFQRANVFPVVFRKVVWLYVEHVGLFHSVPVNIHSVKTLIRRPACFVFPLLVFKLFINVNVAKNNLFWIYQNNAVVLDELEEH